MAAPDNSGKDDAKKPPLYQGLIQSFPRALAAIGEHTAKGAAEPGHHWHGWQETENGFTRFSNAMLRHQMAEGMLSRSDPQLLAEQAIATCWNDLARLEHLLADLED
jgi:hypothetical protein